MVDGVLDVEDSEEGFEEEGVALITGSSPAAWRSSSCWKCALNFAAFASDFAAFASASKCAS